jgi:hypothetical protein
MNMSCKSREIEERRVIRLPLDEARYRRFRRMAADRCVSMGALSREIVEEYMDKAVSEGEPKSAGG